MIFEGVTPIETQFPFVLASDIRGVLTANAVSHVVVDVAIGDECPHKMVLDVIERAVIVNQGEQLRLGDWFMDSSLDNLVSDNLSTLEIVERDYIIKVLEKTNWKIRGKNGAAEILGMQPTTLESRMKKRDIRR